MIPGGYLVQGYGRKRWRALFSLPVNISTAMLLIDYCVNGAITPTSWPARVVPRLSQRALADLQAMRAILAHGTVLRGYFLKYLPHDSPAQHDWSALRNWLEHLADTDIERLIGHGMRSNLEFCRLYPQTPRAAEQVRLLEQLEADEALLEDETFRRSTIQVILDSWGITQQEAAFTLIEHPARLRTAILTFLQELWQQGFSEEWERGKPLVATAADRVQTWLEQEAFARLPEEVIFRVTGLQLPEVWLPMLRQISTVVFVPTLLLGKHLSFSSEQDTLAILYDPGSSLDEPGQAEGLGTLGSAILDPLKKEEAREKRPASTTIQEQRTEYVAFEVMDLEALAPTIRTLGDTTSLTILLVLAEHGEQFAQQVAEKLHVHQSTVSRHFAQLERTGLVSVRPEGGMKFYSVNRQRIKDICQLLLRTFE